MKKKIRLVTWKAVCNQPASKWHHQPAKQPAIN